jgi:eukaryotic-like serine/threonine-protein kinase
MNRSAHHATNRWHKSRPYEILALTGACGMGKVYRGRNGKFDREVAIKVLPGALRNDS